MARLLIAHQEGGVWDYIPPELLDNIKTMLKQPESSDSIAQTMAQLRLVNRHWSSWATGAIAILRVARNGVPLGQLVETFANLRSLKLERMRLITDDELQVLTNDTFVA